MTVNNDLLNALNQGESGHDPDYIRNNRTFNPYQAAPKASGATVEEFNTWTRLQKLDYLSDGAIHTIPSADGSYEYNAFVANGQVFIIELLQKADIAGLSADTQAIIVAHPAWNSTAARLELVPDGTTEGDSAKSYLTGLIGELKDRAESPTFTNNPDETDWDGSPIVDLLEIIEDRLDATVIFSKDEYEEEIKEIEDSLNMLISLYDRPADRDWDASDEFYPYDFDPLKDDSVTIYTRDGSITTKYYRKIKNSNDRDEYIEEGYKNELYNKSTKYYGVASTDRDLNYEQSYETLLSKLEMLATSQSDLQLMKKDRTLFGFELSPSMLAAVLMYYITDQTDIKLEIAAEKMRLHNWWLQEVGKLQEIMQTWLSHFNPEKVDQNRSVAGYSQEDDEHLTYDTISEEDRWVIAMFDQVFALENHPMTDLLGVAVPTIEFFEPIGLVEARADHRGGKYNIVALPEFPTLSRARRYEVEADIEKIENYITQLNAQAQMDQNSVNTQQQRKTHFMEFARNQMKGAENVLRSALATF